MFKSLFIAFSLLVLSIEAKKKSSVTSLGDKTFDEFLSEHDAVFVKFFAPWCGHCKALAPEYEKAAPQLKEMGVEAVDVDCTEAGDLCGANDVKGYPTVKFFQKGKPTIDYEGERKAEAIVSWIKRMRLPAVSKFASSKDAEAFIDESDLLAMGYFDSEAAPEYKVFVEMCEGHRQDLTCGAVFGEKTNFVQVIRGEDDGKEDFTGPFETATFNSWIAAASVPLVAEISPANARTYVEASVPVGFLYADINAPLYESQWKPALIAIAKLYRGKLLFTVVDTNKYARMAKSVGLSGNKFPGFIIENPSKSHYVMSEDSPVTEETLGAFVKSFDDGTLNPTIRSQPIPTTQGDVYTLVGDTFKQVVMDETKDVLVKFYAPWCGHCKAMASDYEALAKHFAPMKDKIVIAEMDATENDAPPPIHITGFPTLMFFPHNDKANPVPYSGGRTTDAMRQFIYEKNTMAVVEPEEPEEAPKPAEEKSDL